MNWIATETGVRIVGGLAFLFILYSVWMGQVRMTGLPDNYTNPVLALELVKNKDHLKQILNAEGGKASELILRNTHKDFGFICVYALFYISLSLLLSTMNVSAARWAGGLAAFSAALAAALDFVENRGMLKAVASGPGSATDSLANSIRYPSLAKWSFLFVCNLLIGLLLVLRRDVFVIPAGLFLLAALLGLGGVIFNLLRPKFYWMFPAALVLLGLGVIFLAIALTFWPAKLLDKFPPH
jgi:hypothetical protein